MKGAEKTGRTKAQGWGEMGVGRGGGCSRGRGAGGDEVRELVGTMS